MEKIAEGVKLGIGLAIGMAVSQVGLILVMNFIDFVFSLTRG